MQIVATMNGHPLIAVNRETLEVLDIDAVARGLNRNHVCASCGDALVAKKGAVNAWHFAHHSTGNNRCVPGGESIIHRLAKDAFREGKRIPLPISAGRLFFEPAEVNQEVWIPEHRIDVVAFGLIYYPHAGGWNEGASPDTSTGVSDEHFDWTADSFDDKNKINCDFEDGFGIQPLLIEIFHTNQKRKYSWIKGFQFRPTKMLAIEINVSYKEIQSARTLTDKTNIQELIEFLIYETPNHLPNHHKRWLAFQEDHAEFERPLKDELEREIQIWDYPEHRTCKCGKWFKPQERYQICWQCYKKARRRKV